MSRRSVDIRKARRSKARSRWAQTEAPAKLGGKAGAGHSKQEDREDTDRDQRGRHVEF